MARQTSNEEESGSLGLGGSSGVAMPGYPAPTSITGVSYNNTRVTTTGVEYNIGLSRQGMQTLDTLSMQFKKQMAAEIVISDNAELTVKGQQYLKDNPSGKGYHKFILDLQQEQMDRAISKAPDRETRLLLANHYKASRNSLFESSYNKELEVGAQFSLGETEKQKQELLTQTYMNPSLAKQNRVIFDLVISNMKPYLGAKYESYRTKELNRFWEATASGDINIDPANAKKKLEAGEYPELTAESRMKLLDHAQTVYRSRLAFAHTLQSRQKELDNEADAFQKELSYQRDYQGTNSIEQINNQEFRREINRERVKSHFYKTQVKYFRDERTISEILEKVNKEEVVGNYSEKDLTKAYRRKLEVKASNNRDASGNLIPLNPLQITGTALEFKVDKEISEYTNSMVNFINNGDSESAYLAAQGIRTVQKVNPKILGDLDEKYKVFAFAVNKVSIAPDDRYRAESLNKIVKTARDTYLKNQDAEKIKNNEAEYRVFRNSRNFNKNFVSVNGDLRQGNWLDSMDFVESISRGRISKEDFKRFGEFGSGVPANYVNDYIIDSEKALGVAFQNKLRGSDAIEYAKELINDMYGDTYLNSPKDSATPIKTKYPLERMYPQYEGTPFLRNKMYRDIQIISKENMRNDHDSNIRLSKDIVEIKSESEYLKADYTKTKFPTIEVKIDGKYQERNVYYRTVNPAFGTVEYYYNLEKGNFLTSQPLKLTTEPIRTESDFRIKDNGASAI